MRKQDSGHWTVEDRTKQEGPLSVGVGVVDCRVMAPFLGGQMGP